MRSPVGGRTVPAIGYEGGTTLTGDARRERVLRTLTFWLRPDFVLRVLNRFQKVAGFDRSIALASGALTATIPLAIVTSAVAMQLGGKGTADRIIDRYELPGAAPRRSGTSSRRPPARARPSASWGSSSS
jgi:type IV secretory pathway TrbD component